MPRTARELHTNGAPLSDARNVCRRQRPGENGAQRVPDAVAVGLPVACAQCLQPAPGSEL